MTARRALSALPFAAALALVALIVLLPVASMLWRSLRIETVVLVDGETVVVNRDVRTTPVGYRFHQRGAPGEPALPRHEPFARVREVRTVFSLRNYEDVVRDPRLESLLVNSLQLAGGAVLVAFLLGLPLAFLLWRTNLPGRRVLLALAVGPAILPAYFTALGAARTFGAALSWIPGLTGEALQKANGALILGCILAPFPMLLVGRALAAAPAAPWEAARLLRGPRAAFFTTTLPAVAPAAAGAAVLVAVLALVEFTVADVLSFVLPPGAQQFHVFSREVQGQWASTTGDAGRAVATGAPMTIAALALVALALVLLRRSPVAGMEARGRPLAALSRRAHAGGWLFVGLVLALSLGVPLVGLASWVEYGETAAAGTGAAATATAHGGRLFDFAGAIENTPGWTEDWLRWLRTALGATVLVLLVSVPLARAAVRGGRWTRGLVLALGVVPLAVPGIVLGAAIVLLGPPLRAVGLGEPGPLGVFALTARLLPFGLLAAWLALREIPGRLEEAAAALGASAPRRAARIWLPLSARGIAVGAVLVLLLALREVEAINFVQTQVFPIRIYDKIHFSRLADEANLIFLYLGHLLVPAAVLAALLRRPRR